MGLIVYLLSTAVQIYIAIIILQVIINWLIIFDVVNAKNEQAQNLIGLLQKATDPVYKPIKKYVPPIGGIDITPLIVILGLNLLLSVVVGALL